jgi:hypothetical protein
VLGAAPRLDLGVDRAGDLVARKEIGCPAVVALVLVPRIRLALGIGGVAPEEIGDVVEHEALAPTVLERPAVAAHALGHEDPSH